MTLRAKCPVIKLSSQTVLMLFDFFSSAPRRLRWESQMERTRAHNKDKWLEHEIWFIALVQKHSQGNSQHWQAMNFKTLSNPKKHTSCYNDIVSLRGLQANCEANQSGCYFWWTILSWVVWRCLKGQLIQMKKSQKGSEGKFLKGFCVFLAWC